MDMLKAWLALPIHTQSTIKVAFGCIYMNDSIDYMTSSGYLSPESWSTFERCLRFNKLVLKFNQVLLHTWMTDKGVIGFGLDVTKIDDVTVYSSLGEFAMLRREVLDIFIKNPVYRPLSVQFLFTIERVTTWWECEGSTWKQSIRPTVFWGVSPVPPAVSTEKVYLSLTRPSCLTQCRNWISTFITGQGL